MKTKPTNVITVNFPKPPVRPQRPISLEEALAKAILQNQKENQAVAQIVQAMLFK